MSNKVFEYEENGLSYTVTLTQSPDGTVSAMITVNSGHMDVNAFYWGDSDHSGPSASLGGPLNMNGGGSRFEGERVQWDGAQPLSRPGLGREGANKETYLTEGQSLGPITLDGVSSLDEIDFFGVRATSTSTPGGSIKGVSVPEEPEEPDHPEDPVCETPDKVFFVFSYNADGAPDNGIFILRDQLDEDAEGTLDDYLDAMLRLYPDAAGETLEEIITYDIAEDGTITETGSYMIGGTVEDGMPLPCICIDEHGDDMLDTETEDYAEVA
ncbi:MAG: hypothetical protein ACK4LQ_01455 [Pararhodobacter sp.]